MVLVVGLRLLEFAAFAALATSVPPTPPSSIPQQWSGAFVPDAPTRTAFRRLARRHSTCTSGNNGWNIPSRPTALFHHSWSNAAFPWQNVGFQRRSLRRSSDDPTLDTVALTSPVATLGCVSDGSRPSDGGMEDTGKNETVENENTTKANAQSPYREMYPPSTSNCNGTLRVDSIHTLYYEEHGRVPAKLLVGSSLKAGREAGSSSSSTCSPMKTALFLHGGPGAGCNPRHARFFDPERYRIVLLDQRGAGRSTPRGEVRNNTLGHLVQDCEVLRQSLGIDRWDVVLGGSWGVTLALAYAQEFPDKVASLVLRGVCLLRSPEVDWLFGSNGGAAALNPEGWGSFEGAVGLRLSRNGTERTCENIGREAMSNRAALHAHYDRLLGDDPDMRLKAAWSWFQWEMSVSRGESPQRPTNANETATGGGDALVLAWECDVGWTYQDAKGAKLDAKGATRVGLRDASASLRRWPPSLRSTLSTFSTNLSTALPQVRPVRVVETCPDQEIPRDPALNISNATAKGFVPAQAMLTCFYSVNEKFVMNDFDLLSKERIRRIQHIPCIAIQGELDGICPPDTALDLHKAWPEMELRIPISAGHSMYDPPITNEILRATDSFS